MSNYNEIIDDEDLEERRRIARARKRAEMRRKKKQQLMIRRLMKVGIPCLVSLIILVIAISKLTHRAGEASDTITSNIEGGQNSSLSNGNQIDEVIKDDFSVSDDEELNSSISVANGVDGSNIDALGGQIGADTDFYTPMETDQTAAVPGEVVSTSAIMVDVNNSSIVAQRDSKAVISPASMTKVLTVLVAAEHVTNFDDPVTITFEDTDFSFTNDCSNVGFEVGETVPVKDLFYGTILPSGADAAMALATYVAGSPEAFVQMMNEKASQLGISNTANFTNCVGLYDENHHCSVYDMAIIMKAAMDNEFCREVLSTHVYTTTSTEQHPEGLILSNWFLRRIEDKDAGGLVLGAKTGYVVQSGNCAVSYALDANQNGYICVTANSSSGWRCIYDHVAIYKQFLPQ